MALPPRPKPSLEILALIKHPWLALQREGKWMGGKRRDEKRGEVT